MAVAMTTQYVRDERMLVAAGLPWGQNAGRACGLCARVMGKLDWGPSLGLGLKLWWEVAL